MKNDLNRKKETVSKGVNQGARCYKLVAVAALVVGIHVSKT
jgi:hypothetical protein